MDDVTALRDALVRGLQDDEVGLFDGELSDRLDALIAAVEARAAKVVPSPGGASAPALTTERLAKAVMEVDGQTDEYLTRFPAVREANLEYATAILAALPRPEEPRVERCAVCGVGRWVIAHDPEAGPSYHPFTPEAR